MPTVAISREPSLVNHLPYLRSLARSLKDDRIAADDLLEETLRQALLLVETRDETVPVVDWLEDLLRANAARPPRPH